MLGVDAGLAFGATGGVAPGWHLARYRGVVVVGPPVALVADTQLLSCRLSWS